MRTDRRDNKQFDLELDTYDNEVWIHVRGYTKKYCVSNFGRVITFKKGITWLVCGTYDKNGYHIITIKQTDGKIKKKKVHILVAEYFLEKPSDEELCINHFDGNKSNNHVSNLEWVTLSENMYHARITGLLDTTGVNNVKHILSESSVKLSRIMYKYGKRLQREIAEIMGVNHRTINLVVRKINWTWVTD